MHISHNFIFFYKYGHLCLPKNKMSKAIKPESMFQNIRLLHKPMGAFMVALSTI